MPATHSDLLAGLAPVEAQSVAALGRPIRLDAGEVLFNLGDVADAVYLIRRGRIALTLPLHVAGTEQDAFIEERLPGQTLGWSALIPPFRFTLKATAPLETELIALPRVPLLAYCSERPHVGYAVALNLASVVGQRLQVFQAMWLREMQRLVNARA
jgi:CRP-like cAMP-binding protein